MPRNVAQILGKCSSRLPGLVVLLLVATFCELASVWRGINEHYFPSVTRVLACLFHPPLLMDLGRELLISLKRIVIGFGLGVAVGYTVGFLCGYARDKVYPWVGLTIEYLRPIPSLAIIPVFILFFGIGDCLNVSIIAWACSWPVLVNTMEAVGSTDPVLLNTARTLGLSRRAVIWKVVRPSSLPYLFSGMRISLGIAVSVATITEMVASGTGLGSFILEASQSFRVSEMYAGITAIALLGWALNRILCRMEARMIGWHNNGSGI